MSEMNPVSMHKAAKLVVNRACVYSTNARPPYYRVEIKVWTKSLTDIDLLERVFGGNHYPHRSGYYWILGERKDQLRLLKLVRPWIPGEGSRLQKLIDYETRLREASS